MLHIRKSLIGDTAKCSVYLPFALKEARRMHSNGGGTKNFIIDDLRIRVHVVGDEGLVQIIDTCLTYLEAGALDIGQHGLGYIPEVTGSEVYPDGLTGITVGGKKLTLPNGNPYKSKLFGLKVPPTELPIKPPPDRNLYRDDLTGIVDPVAYQCALTPDQCDLLKKKHMLQYLNPSKGTGKMRLFLQTLVGSDMLNRLTPDLGKNMVVTGVFLDKVLRIDPLSYIIRDANGNYWMLYGHASAFLMQFDRCVDAVKHTLKGGGLTRQREIELETVLFSHLVVPPPDEKELALAAAAEALGGYYQAQPAGWSTCPFPTRDGGPVAHAWHFKYQGLEAVRVRVIEKETNPILYESHVEYARFQTHPVVEGKQPAPPTISIVTTETVEWSLVRGLSRIFRVIAFPYAKQTADYPVPLYKDGVYDGPVYAFYDANDQLIMARFKKGLRANNDPVVNIENLRDSCDAGRQITTTTFASQTYGFYVTGAASFNGVDSMADVLSRYDIDQVKGSGPHSVWIGGAQSKANSYLPAGCDGTPAIPLNTDASTAYGQDRATNLLVTNVRVGSTIHSAVLLLTIENPDSMYVGSSTRTSLDGTDIVVAYNEANVAEWVDFTTLGHQTAQYSWRTSGYEVIGTAEEVYDLTVNNHVQFISQHHSLPYNNSFSHTLRGPGVSYYTPPTVWNDVFYPEVYTFLADFDRVHFRANESMGGRLWYNTEEHVVVVAGGTFPAKQDIHFTGYS